MRPDVQEVRALDRVALAEAVRGAVGGHVDADAGDLVRHALVPEELVHHRALLRGVERDRARRAEDGLVDREPDRGLVVRGRDEHRALRRER